MNEIKLSEGQEELILDEWNSRRDSPPGIKELTQKVFPDIPQELRDGRSKYGRAIKRFLATRKIKAKGTHEYDKKDKIELTEEQKEYSRNNAAMMTGNEIARIVFSDNELMPLSQETRTINKYIKSLDVEIFEPPSGAEPTSEYKPPGTYDRTFSKIIKYVPSPPEKSRLTPKQKKDVQSLMGFLKSFRFQHQINSYSSETDRCLFESSFIRYTYDKSDLSEEEVDQYLVLAIEVVISSTIQRRIDHLSRLLDDAANDTEGRRISMSLVESISKSQTEYNQCVNRQQKLLGDLKEKRSAKLNKQIKASASILNLVEMWKEEESRKRMIQLAEMRKQTVKKEVEKLRSISELKAKILGLSENEVFNG